MVAPAFIWILTVFLYCWVVCLSPLKLSFHLLCACIQRLIKMFLCGKDTKTKRKPSGWRHRASCVQGNHSFDGNLDASQYYKLTDRDALPSPCKKFRPTTPGGLSTIPETETVDFGQEAVDLSGYDLDEDKENLGVNVNLYWFKKQSEKRKNNLYLAEMSSPQRGASAKHTPSDFKSVSKDIRHSNVKSNATSRADYSDSMYNSLDCETTDDGSKLLDNKTCHVSADSGINSMTHASRNTSGSLIKKHCTEQDKLRKILEFPRFNITVMKSAAGYGFTVKGTTPVRVGRIKPGGAAEKEGLKQGDFILGINSNDITQASVDAVADMVRHSSKEITLEICRKSQKCRKSLAASESSSSVPVMETLSSSCVTDVISTASCEESIISASKELAAAENLAKWGADLSQHALGDLDTQSLWQPELSVIREEKSTDFMSTRGTPASTRWHPDISYIAKPNDVKIFAQSRVHPLKELTECQQQSLADIGTSMASSRSRFSSWSSLTSDDLSSCQPDSYTESDSSQTSGSNHTYSNNHNQQRRKKTDDESYVCPPNTENETSLDESRPQPIRTSLARPTDQSETSRQVATHQLLTSEQDFCRLMKRGIQRFSRPLRHHIMSRAQHRGLFQNIEKLVALSEFHIGSLMSKSFCTEDSYVSSVETENLDGVGQLYQAKIKLVCEAYDMYSLGHSEAQALLNQLKQDRQFYKFIKKLENLKGFELTLTEFLQQPMSHFHQLVGNLDRVLSTTPRDHHDYTHIRHVCKAMHQHITRASGKPTNKSDSSTHHYHGNNSASMTTSTTSYGRSMSRKRSWAASSSSESSSSTKSGSRLSTFNGTVDIEILELQHKLGFSENVKPFHLAVPGRHILFSGEVHGVVGDRAAPLWAVLCSDLLLLTEKDVKGHFKVVKEPLFLHQVFDMDFYCQTGCEFQLFVQKSQLSSSVDHQRALSTCGVTEYRFQATNMEQKWAWKTLLEQRIKTCKTYTDSAFCSMEEII